MNRLLGLAGAVVPRVRSCWPVPEILPPERAPRRAIAADRRAGAVDLEAQP